MELRASENGAVSAAARAGDDEPRGVDEVRGVRVKLRRYPSVGGAQIGEEVVAAGFGEDAIVRGDEGPLAAEDRFEKPWADGSPGAANLREVQWEVWLDEIGLNSGYKRGAEDYKR